MGTNVFDICKAVESRGKAYNTEGIIIEHVVPAKVYLGDVKEKYAHNMFTFEYFKKVFDAVSICLVSKKQDAPASPGVPGQVLGLGANQTPVWINQSGGGGDVSDVKINQSSI